MNAKLSRDNASLNQRIPMPTRYCVRTIAELFSRPIVGWSMQCICGSVVTDALPVATFRCRLAPGLIFRPDRPGQYCRHSFQDGLTEYDMTSSKSGAARWRWNSAGSRPSINTRCPLNGESPWMPKQGQGQAG